MADGRGLRAFAAVGLILALLLLPGLSSAAPPANGAPVATGKVVADGAFGVPFADTSSLSFPSSPPIGASPLSDGDLVYDTQVSVEIVDATPAALSLSVVAETWTPGTITVDELRTVGNNTTLVPVTVPARLDARWSNATVSALGDSSGVVSVPLPDVSSSVHLEVHVGAAVWELRYLTAATSVVSEIYTGGGFWGFVTGFSIETFAAVGVAMAFGKRLAARVHAVPAVPFLWPALWIGVPIGAFLLAYVPLNQGLAGASPFVAPLPVAVAAFPYFARIFGKRANDRLEGIEARGLQEARKAEALVFTVASEQGIRCAPRTWREVFYTLAGVPLPELQGEQLDILGSKVRVQPQGMAVSKLLPGWEFRPEADMVYWVDAAAPVGVTFHRFRLTREVEVEKTVTGPDGKPAVERRKRRRISPHVERGSIRARFPPTKPVLEVLSGVRQAEDLAHENEAVHLALAEMRGTIWRKVRTARLQTEMAVEREYQVEDAVQSADESRRLVERGAGGKGRNGSAQGPRKAPESEEQ